MRIQPEPTGHVGRSVFRFLLEAAAAFSVAACALTLLLRYRFLPQQIPDLFSFGSGLVSKRDLIYLFLIQMAAYLLLTVFQFHPSWRMYSSKLLPILKDGQSRNDLYRFSSFFLLLAKTEAVFLLGIVIVGTVSGKNITLPALVMMAVIVCTMVFFKTDLPKQNVRNLGGR